MLDYAWFLYLALHRFYYNVYFTSSIMLPMAWKKAYDAENIFTSRNSERVCIYKSLVVVGTTSIVVVPFLHQKRLFIYLVRRNLSWNPLQLSAFTRNDCLFTYIFSQISFGAPSYLSPNPDWEKLGQQSTLTNLFFKMSEAAISYIKKPTPPLLPPIRK